MRSGWHRGLQLPGISVLPKPTTSPINTALRLFTRRSEFVSPRRTRSAIPRRSLARDVVIDLFPGLEQTLAWSIVQNFDHGPPG